MLHVYLAITQDLVKQSRANDVARMDRHNGASSIGMAQEMMTAPDADLLESPAFECGDEFLRSDARDAGHAATATVIR